MTPILWTIIALLAIFGLLALVSYLLRDRPRRDPCVYPRHRRSPPVYLLLPLLLLPLVGCQSGPLAGISTSLGLTKPVPAKTLAELADAYAGAVNLLNVEIHAGRFAPATIRTIQADSHAARKALDAAGADAAAGKAVSPATLAAIAQLVGVVVDASKQTPTVPVTAVSVPPATVPTLPEIAP